MRSLAASFPTDSTVDHIDVTAASAPPSIALVAARRTLPLSVSMFRNAVSSSDSKRISSAAFCKAFQSQQCTIGVDCQDVPETVEYPRSCGMLCQLDTPAEALAMQWCLLQRLGSWLKVLKGPKALLSQSVLCTFEAYIHEGCPPTTYYAYLVSAMDAVGKNPARFNFIRCNVDIVPGLRQQCDIMFCNHVEQSIVLRAPLSCHCRAGVPCAYTEDELLALVLSGRDIYEKMTPLACKPKRFELQTLVTPSPSGHPMEAKHNSQETQR